MSNPIPDSRTPRLLRRSLYGLLAVQELEPDTGPEMKHYLERVRKGAQRMGNLIDDLLDLKLPKVSGLEILRFIKGQPALSSIPVVVLTSSREDRDIIESYELGVNSYIVKPVTFEQVVESVRQIGLYWLLLNQTPPPGNAHYPPKNHPQGSP